jgi:hypothetical protein
VQVWWGVKDRSSSSVLILYVGVSIEMDGFKIMWSIELCAWMRPNQSIVEKDAEEEEEEEAEENLNLKWALAEVSMKQAGGWATERSYA